VTVSGPRDERRKELVELIQREYLERPKANVDVVSAL
jgi:hypothetical protein